jgi:streptogramin lyase
MPVVVSDMRFGTIPRGIATDGGSSIWACDTGLVHIDASTGTSTRLGLNAPTSQMPLPSGLASLRWRGDGFLYVVNVHGTGTFIDNLNSGIYRVDPRTGDAIHLSYGFTLSFGFTESFVFDASGEIWQSQVYLIHGTAYGPTGYVVGPGVDQVFPQRGALAIVPPGIATPARKSSWSAIKRLYH